ncbi:MAG: class I SAM-dependent methyltransferase [Eudoraea sp.]|nr:class I SAM-dependent methyltransferase [Eudoraea sp.]
MKNHWDKVYTRKGFDQLGWYEKSPEPTMDLIRMCELSPDSPILIAGAGASTLIDRLLHEGFLQITANDLSMNALDQAKERLGPDLSARVEWVADDLIQPVILGLGPQVELWHDRAVLHFFNEPAQREAYFKLLRSKLAAGGHAIIAGFNLQGAEKCSGLPVCRRNADLLSREMGPEFELIKSFDYRHTMPSGEVRDYIYTLFRRKA